MNLSSLRFALKLKHATFFGISLLLALFLAGTFALSGCSGSKSKSSDVESALEQVKSNLFGVSYDDVKSKYPNATVSKDNLDIGMPFAGINGYFHIVFDKKKMVDRVIYKWDSSTEFDANEVVNQINLALGDYCQYEAKYPYYRWKNNGVKVDFYPKDGIWIDSYSGPQVKAESSNSTSSNSEASNNSSSSSSSNSKSEASSSSTEGSAAVNTVQIDSIKALPSSLMDDTIKGYVALLDSTLSESGLQEKYGTESFFQNGLKLENGTFAGMESYKATMVYDSIEDVNAKPKKLTLMFTTVLKGDGSEETEKLIKATAKSLGINQPKYTTAPFSGANCAIEINGADLNLSFENNDGSVIVSITKK